MEKPTSEGRSSVSDLSHSTKPPLSRVMIRQNDAVAYNCIKTKFEFGRLVRLVMASWAFGENEDEHRMRRF